MNFSDGVCLLELALSASDDDEHRPWFHRGLAAGSLVCQHMALCDAASIDTAKLVRHAKRGLTLSRLEKTVLEFLSFFSFEPVLQSEAGVLDQQRNRYFCEIHFLAVSMLC